jgi:hypothetical protein
MISLRLAAGEADDIGEALRRADSLAGCVADDAAEDCAANGASRLGLVAAAKLGACKPAKHGAGSRADDRLLSRWMVTSRTEVTVP